LTIIGLHGTRRKCLKQLRIFNAPHAMALFPKMLKCRSQNTFYETVKVEMKNTSRRFKRGEATMKEISELNLPDDLKYSEDHEWAQPGGDTIRVGITDYAQDQLGDIVYVDLPRIGDTFTKGDEFGTVESVKAVSELFMPVGGKVVAVNTDLEDSPDLVNQDPYTRGWMVDIKPGDASGIENLMDKGSYLEMLKGL